VDPERRDEWLGRLREELQRARIQRRTVTYLQLADALCIPPPRRIHTVTRLLELLLNDDVRAGRPAAGGAAVSRVRGGLPAPGFFDRARRLGLALGDNPAQFHAEILKSLYEDNGNN